MSAISVLQPRRPTIGCFLVLVLAACGAPVETLEPPQPVTESVPAENDTAPPAVSSRVVRPIAGDTVQAQPEGFVIQDRMTQLDGKDVILAEDPRDALGGSLVPWAVPAFDGAAIYYTAWTEGRDLDQLAEGEVGGIPVIRRVDASGNDQVFRHGAYAVAPANDGRVAYVEDLDGVYRHSSSNPNMIRVVSADGAADEVWSTEPDARYVTVGWADNALLAYKVGEGESIQTFAFDGPGEMRLLTDDGVVGAISPSGEWVLLVEKNASGRATNLVVARPSDGARLESVEINTELGPVNGTHQGDWQNDRIVLGPGAGDGIEFPYVSGYAVLGFDGQDLVLERLVAFEGIADMVSLEAPRFTSSGGVWARVITTRKNGSEFWYFDLLCSEDGSSCNPVSEPREVSDTTPILENKSGGR